MKKNIFTLVILFLFFVANGVYSQSSISNGAKTVIQWKSVENASSYKLEIRPENDKQILLNLKENEVLLDLKPGKYEYRVGALNKFKKVKHWSKWYPLDVIYSEPPQIQEDSKYTFTLPEKEKEIVVKGKHFLEEIELELESSSEKIPIQNFKRISDSELRFTVNFESKTKPEQWGIILRNPLNKVTKKKSFIVLEEKPKPKDSEVANKEERGEEKKEEFVKDTKDAKEAKEVIETKEGKETTESKETVEAKEAIEKKPYAADVLPPLWRSSLLPGWGQYYKGEKTKAYIFGGSVFFFLGSVFFFESSKDYSVSRSERYSNLLFLLPGERNLLPAALYLRNESIQSRREAQENLDRQEAVLGIAAAIYVFNIADILWNRKPAEKILDTNEKTSGLFLNVGNQGRGSFQFGFSYRF